MGILRGLIRIAELLVRRAEQELQEQKDAIREELMELNRKLDAGAVTEAEFARREAELVERLTKLDEHRRPGGQHGSG